MDNKIFDILANRHKNYLVYYFSRIPLEQRSKVKYITMDMWETYLDVAKRYFKNAKIAIDSFHVMEVVNNAMNKVRLSVMQKFNKKTDNLDAWLNQQKEEKEMKEKAKQTKKPKSKIGI